MLELAVINKIKEPPNTGFDQCGVACDLKQCQKSFCGWAWMGIWNPNSGWVVDDDKLRSGYSSSRSVDMESLVSCVLFYIWVLFVCLHVSVFVVCFSMERWKCIGFGDGVVSLLHREWSLWGCVSHLWVMVGSVILGESRRMGLKEEEEVPQP
jgi:hypothetical protein